MKARINICIKNLDYPEMELKADTLAIDIEQECTLREMKGVTNLFDELFKRMQKLFPEATIDTEI